jgi:hypothetical protein
MPGSCNNGKPHYRCNFLSQYAAKNKVNHPNYSANASCSPDQAK